MIEERKFKIDWFKAYIISYDWDLISVFAKILGITPNLQAKDEVLGQKFWHEIWSSDTGATFCAYRPPSQAQIQIHKYCVELTGKFLSSLPLIQLRELCQFCNQQDDFQVKRIDLTCDFFPCQGLNLKPWETYLDNGQLADYRSVKRILNSDRGDCSSTVYLGSRRSESMVRLYSKNIDGKFWDRWELELKGYKADQAVEVFINQGARPLLEILFGSIILNEPWFQEFKLSEGVKLVARQEQTNLERSIKFLWSISASLAMIQSFLGEEKFNSLINRITVSGKLKLKNRHHAAIREAVVTGVKVGILAIAFTSLAFPAFASQSQYLTCPVAQNQSIFGQLPQKFPMDIVLPNSTEQTQFEQFGSGCFQMNTGGGSREVCTPGMLVSAIKPFIIIGVGIKFIFSG